MKNLSEIIKKGLKIIDFFSLLSAKKKVSRKGAKAQRNIYTDKINYTQRLRFACCQLHTVFCFLLLTSYFLLESCANIVNPSGGPKDILPPKIVKASPDTFSTHFSAKEIEITFDEYVQLRDLSTQLVVSPPLKNAPEVKVKKKSIVIRLMDTLMANTTYTFNFGNAIADITENNAAENFQYVFSTGDYIDSLFVEGSVVNAKTLAPEKGVMVMLHRERSDSVIYKERPVYFAKTDASGAFRISNVAKGEFKIAALKDANSNYLYDQPGEAIGFSDSIVDPSKAKSQKLLLFKEIQAKQRIVKTFSDQVGKAVVILASPAPGAGVGPINHKPTGDESYIEYSEYGDTISYWIADTTLDTLYLKISDISGFLDTARIAMMKKNSPAYKKRKFALTATLNIPNGGTADLNSPVKLLFSHPLLIPDNGTQEWDKKLIFKKDSIADSVGIHTDYYPYNKGYMLMYTRGLVLVKSDTVETIHPVTGKKTPVQTYKPEIIEENSSYHFYLPPGTVTDIFGLTNDTIDIHFKTKSEKDYGTLVLKLKPPADSTNYIVLLVDEKDQVVYERTILKEEKITCTRLAPKSYRIKVIHDKNNNGIWDTGNYLVKKQPEKVFYFKQSITVRANWDVETEWDFSKQ